MRHIKPEIPFRQARFSIGSGRKTDGVWIYPQTTGHNLSQRRPRDGKTPAVPDEAKAASASFLVFCQQVFQSAEDSIRLLQVNPPYMHMRVRHR